MQASTRTTSDSAQPTGQATRAAGGNFVFGDGSVRFLRYGIDPEQFRRACVINDGLALNLD
jgi:prepilin-type processing-associated H-X9-DG protein